jgi:2Fe-2S ferredoxin
MPKIIYVGHDGTERAVDANVGDSLMTVAVNNDVPGIGGECGGEMACGTCHVRVSDEWMATVRERTADEAEMIEELIVDQLNPDSRLGCQILVSSDLDGLRVAVPHAAF